MPLPDPAVNRYSHHFSFIATVELGVSDSVYRITRFSGFRHGFENTMVSWSSIDLVHGHGHDERQCIMKSTYILLSTLQSLFIRFIPFRVITSFFSPTYPFRYIYRFSLQVYIEYVWESS